jgi:enoyl-CoA hydratase/carnithine racemase
MSEYQNWALEDDSRIATLTLNRPEQSNALTIETFKELQDIAARIEANQDVWAVVVEGRGKHFSIGVDLSVIHSIVDYPEEPFRRELLEMQHALDAFEALQKPTIAKLHGFCLGGGMVLALCCDFRIASQRTVLGLPEVKRGIPVIAGTQRVTRITGVAAAKELVLLGKNIKIQNAKEIGLVHAVVPEDQLDQTVHSFAEQFLRLPPRTVGAAKQIIDEGSYLSLRASQDLEIEIMQKLLRSPDFKEAITSFIEGRSPEYIGK